MTYPPIEPSTYDLIVVGTGLPESIVAAAASAAGKSVLHLDPNSFYGSHFSSLTLDELAGFLTSEPTVTSVTPSDPQCLSPPSTDDSDYLCVGLQNRPMYHDVEITTQSSQPSEKSRKFNIDVAGPRVLYCADSSIDLMQKSGTNQYIEFKSVDASFVCDSYGKLSTVPDSRAAIFKDQSLSLPEKYQLMRIFKIVQRHFASESGNDDENSRISDQDLESPFVDYLQKLRLPLKIKSFPNAPGALIYPIYGQGELPQAFCRRAAIKGSIYVLRMDVVSMLMDKFSPGSAKGKIARGICIASSYLKPDLLNILLIYPP